MAAGKRKHTAVEDAATQRDSRGQQDIKVFGAIGKHHTLKDTHKKRKTTHHNVPTPESPQAAEPKSNNKRKRAADYGELDHSPEEAQQDTAEEGIVRSNVERAIATPQSKRFKNVHPPSPKETPSKNAAALFNRLKLGRTTTSIPFSIKPGSKAYQTPPDTPQSPITVDYELPKELHELLQLHAAFLSALSLYYAHNGTSSVVDVKVLLLMVTKHWRKRTVSLDDLRVLLAVVMDDGPSFILKDFGRAGISLIKPQSRGRAIKRAASFVDEVDLNTRFEEALRARWAQWKSTTPQDDHMPELFVDQLPLADVEKDESIEKAAPMFARGKQRLAELKSSQASVQPEPSASSTVTNEQKTTGAIQNRGTTLLDRILAKQALSATLPAGPTKEQLERKAALQRIEEIARVVDLLATGRSRCSFSMQAIVQQLQQSLRNPISREETQRCVELMAGEVTPGFVSLVRNGAVTGVVITKSGKVGLGELRHRVQIASDTGA